MTADLAAARAPSFYWSGRPVYRCRFCGDRYERVEDLGAVLEHEASQHPTTLRTSPILGPDGGAVQALEEHTPESSPPAVEDEPGAGDLVHIPGLPAGVGLRVQLEEDSDE